MSKIVSEQRLNKYHRFLTQIGLVLIFVWWISIGTFSRIIFLGSSYLFLACPFVGLLLVHIGSRSAFLIRKTDLLFVLVFLIISLNNGDLLSGTFSYVVQFVFGVVSLIVFRNKPHLVKKLFKLMFLFGLICAIFTILFAFIPEFYLSNVAPLSIVPETTALLFKNGANPGLAWQSGSNAMYLMLSFIFCTVSLFYNTKKKRWYSIFLLLSTIILLIGILLSSKRSAFFFCIALLVIVFIFNENLSFQKKIFVLFLAFFALIIVSYFIPNLFSVLIKNESLISEGDFLHGRLELYSLALNLFEENSLIGIGWGNFKYLTNGFEVHNIYLQILCETGILGFILIVGSLIIFLIFSIIVQNKYKNNITLKFILFFNLYFLIYGLVGNTIEDFEALFPFFLSISYVTSGCFCLVKKEGAYESRNINLSICS